MKLHAFVAMPFGVKNDSQGRRIDFTRVYQELIKPALELAALDVIRADEERSAGDIREDMFQELLMADLVLADLSIDNPNVWYELGVRHALRAGGVVLIQGPRDTKPFDTYTDRKYTYHLKDGVPDPDFLEQDKQAIARLARSTLEPKFKRVVSPVYSLLPNLSEPRWKSLRIGAAKNYWAHYDEWAKRVELARKAGHPEDILVLANEPPVTALRVDALIKAGKSLLECKLYSFALEQFAIASQFEPANEEINSFQGICLQRLGRYNEARAIYRGILEEKPWDAETWALLGKVEKEVWLRCWDVPGATKDDLRDNASYEDVALLNAIQYYFTAFELAPDHYYSGINALTLMALYHDLTGNQTPWSHQFELMANSLGWSARCEKARSRLYWSRATLAELAILQGSPADVKTAFKYAIAAAENDWFALDATLTQLRLLERLDFLKENVSCAIRVFERALEQLTPPDKKWQPQRVFLFSGHRIDMPQALTPRFPEDKAEIAAKAIAAALENAGATENDLALTQGAAGGDILFAEAALARNMHLQLLQPCSEPEFIERSILPSVNGEKWRKRYYRIRNHPLCMPVRSMPTCLGPLSRSHDGNEMNPYERCNRWLLYSALIYGIEQVQFICLWNGSSGNGPGGTASMYKEVQRRTGDITWLDTRTLW